MRHFMDQKLMLNKNIVNEKVPRLAGLLTVKYFSKILCINYLAKAFTLFAKPLLRLAALFL